MTNTELAKQHGARRYLTGDECIYFTPEQLDAYTQAAIAATQGPDLTAAYMAGVERGKDMAAAQAVKAVPGWQLIESAPEDMSSRMYLVGRYCVQGFTDVTGALLVQGEIPPHYRKMRGKPTHWMPLPPAPGAPQPPAKQQDHSAGGECGRGQATETEKRPCRWAEDDPWGSMPGTYASACGQLWSFIDGGPKENSVNFCQGCGQPVEVVPFLDDEATHNIRHATQSKEGV